ncbi:MAG: PAS domain S-box protein [Proteobacteria bacterium]|nr:PAS domain S-box protein [Pseudomonadota bacterium]
MDDSTRRELGTGEPEDELRECGVLAHAVLEASIHGIVVIDALGRITLFNPASERLFGYRADEVLGRDVRMLVPEGFHPEPEGPVADGARDAAVDVIGTGREVTGLRKDGRSVALDLFVSREPSGDRAYSIGVFNGAEQRKRFEAALRESEKTALALLNAIQESAMLLDTEGRVLAINETGADRLGCAPDDIVGRLLDDFLPEELASRRRGHLEKTLRSKAPVRFEDSRANRVFNSVIYPILNDDWDVVRLAAFASDVTEWKQAEEALLKSQAFLEEAQQIARVGNWAWDLASNQIDWSDTLCRILEVNPEGLGGTYGAFLSLVHPEDRDLVRKTMSRAIFEEENFDIEYRMILPDETVIHVQARADVILDDDDEPIRVVGTVQDITERKRVERELRIKDFAIQSSINPIAMTDLSGTITYVNESWLKAWGLEGADQALGQDLSPFFTEDDKVGEMLMGLSAETVWLGEMKAGRADGTAFDLLVSASLVRDLDDRPLCNMLSCLDVTEKKRNEELLRYQAIYDALTGLFNRRHFMERLDTAVKEASRHRQPLTVCLCDLDYFKSVNDTFGHQAGDRVLETFGRLVKEAVRAEDTAGRYGGEEFAMILPHTAAGSAFQVLERIRRHLEATGFEDEHGTPFRVTASFGLAEMTPENSQVASLLECADQALYRAKGRGRNQVVTYDPADVAEFAELGAHPLS